MDIPDGVIFLSDRVRDEPQPSVDDLQDAAPVDPEIEELAAKVESLLKSARG